MQDRDREILHHTGLYRVTLRPVLAKLFFNGGDPDKVLLRLRNEGYLRPAVDFQGISLYQLTKKGASAVGLPEDRARRFREQALYKHLGLLLFCFDEGSKRVRLEDGDLESLFGEKIPDGTHCVDSLDGKIVIDNVYVPGPQTSIRAVVRRVRDSIHASDQNPVLRQYVDDRRYRYVVLVEHDSKREALMKAFRKPERDGLGPLIKQAHVHVESLVAPLRHKS